MTAKRLNEIRNTVKNENPIIHSITNPISINQCANAVLAVGGRPIMAEHPEEVFEITKTAKALTLNLGNITDVRMKSMMISAQSAKENNIACVLDAVGVSCSELRRKFANEIIEKYCPDVIKGNYSEINALASADYSSDGVDADTSLEEKYISGTAVKLAKRLDTIILASGKTDIVTDGKRLIHIKNGTPRLAKVTGTGCMLGVLCSCYMAAVRDISSAVTACGVLGICGELASAAHGNGSFAVRLTDELSLLSDEDFEKYLRLEEIEIEKI